MWKLNDASQSNGNAGMQIAVSAATTHETKWHVI